MGGGLTTFLPPTEDRERKNKKNWKGEEDRVIIE
jgi:hypothetical protein